MKNGWILLSPTGIMKNISTIMLKDLWLMTKFTTSLATC